MNLQDRIEAAKARKAKAEAALTPELKKEIEAREAAEAAEAEAAELEGKLRAHALAEAVERLSIKNGPHLRPVDLESRQAGHGVWIVKPADKEVMRAFHAAAKKPNADSDAMNRQVAEACVIHWNGKDEDTIDGEAMHALWDTFGAIPTTLGNAAIELGGFVADTRKSGG